MGNPQIWREILSLGLVCSLGRNLSLCFWPCGHAKQDVLRWALTETPTITTTSTTINSNTLVQDANKQPMCYCAVLFYSFQITSTKRHHYTLQLLQKQNILVSDVNK